VTPLYPQKLALTSPTGGGRFVGIVRSRTKATEFRHQCMSFSLFRKTRVSLTPFYEEYGETGLELSLLGHFISNCILYVRFASISCIM